MSRLAGRGALALMGIAACLGLAGCVYDYTNHEDRLSYSAGDAVKANLIKETVDPEYPGMYSKKGLGRNGILIPKPVTETKTSATTISSTSTTTSP